MLICVTPAELARETRGGETVIHGYQCSLKSRASTTPGRALIFRKDLEHEGAEVAAGEKHVLALNLWAVRKQNSSQVLLVDFFEGDDAVVVGDESRESALLAAAKQPAFAIPVGYLRDKDNVLLRTVQQANRQANEDGCPPPILVQYTCRDFTPTEFETVFRVLMHQRISEKAVVAHAHVLQYFGHS